MKKIAVLVSGGGTNLQALIDEEKKGNIKNGKIYVVISSNPEAYALKRASDNNIKSIVVDRKTCKTKEEFDFKMLKTLKENKPDLIVLAGFMQILGETIINSFENKIINVHPSLIPSFCGDGFYGIKVHEAAINKGVKISGATVHFVNDKADDGAIIIQKAVEVKDCDTPKDLQLRIMKEAEQIILPKAVDYFCNDMIEVKEDKVYIKKIKKGVKSGLSK